MGLWFSKLMSFFGEKEVCTSRPYDHVPAAPSPAPRGLRYARRGPGFFRRRCHPLVQPAAAHGGRG
jgi:hypothetical protein